MSLRHSLFFLSQLCLLLLISTHRATAAPAPALQPYTNKVTALYRFVRFRPIAAMHPRLTTFKHQPVAWRRRMAILGQRYKAAQVRAIYFVHGTFVGLDPFGLVRLFDYQSDKRKRRIHHALKRNANRIFGDAGNYTPAYLKLFKRALQVPIAVHHVPWSSGNHHDARVRGSYRLVAKISADLQRNPSLRKGRILLHGHSHAGQLFALLTHYLAATPQAKAIARITLPPKQERQFWQHMQKLRQLRFDIVTFGAPPRYRWVLSKRVRLLHIINHRGNTPFGGTWWDMHHTTHGDYIQQWGIAGSDLLASSSKAKKSNRALVPWLGPGSSAVAWQKFAKFRMRLHHKGQHLLVDYQDQAKILPNSFQTMAGHAIYTRFQKMLFNTKLIADHFYPQRPSTSRAIPIQRPVP